MRNTAVVVDDVELNRELLADMLIDYYEVLETADGEEAIRLIERKKDSIAVLLLDLIMPKKNGLDVLNWLQENSLLDKFPVLIISGESDAGIEEQCLKMGVVDFIKKPFNTELARHRIQNAESLFSYKNHLEDLVRAQVEEIKEKNNKLEEKNEEVIWLLADVVEARDTESGEHVKRVREATRCLLYEVKNSCPEYGLTQAMIDCIARASVLHDIGKIRIVDSILLKPGRLTPEEFNEMKKHTIFGCELLEKSKHIWDDDFYKYSQNICRYHHERWDGKGYPEGLKGEEIPIEAQVVAVIDCFDALTSERPYKKAFSAKKAYTMISNNECGTFSPKLYACLARCYENIITEMGV